MREVIETFNKLMSEAQASGNKPYAAFCALGIAKYQEELKGSGGLISEGFSYFEAGTLLWEASLQSLALQHNMYDNFLMEATNAYSKAIDATFSPSFYCHFSPSSHFSSPRYSSNRTSWKWQEYSILKLGHS